METTFCITLNIKTGTGFECFGKFFMGYVKEFAENTFNKLKGNKDVTDGNILHLDLMAIRNDLPMNVHMISCTLEELAENCRIITRETFKIFNIDSKQ